eukprot:CAMPEP_0201250264 /NCGR_PEP_ID=MMETSP0852-20130820/62891_1 /ASSEMBLY_ACC=CAM_ASM_000632 /TAXON_ID=183588 /ORGANISM="Pseudo-nitzschia fraudulenta, Strain WWA7" /LENGTH=51 /DNA_ID=CAMNT_0047549555 /DNA_START=169 /DNA_END=321 /DNA_ORIENTATION=-
MLGSMDTVGTPVGVAEGIPTGAMDLDGNDVGLALGEMLVVGLAVGTLVGLR